MLARKDMTEIMGAEGWDIPVEEIQDPEMAVDRKVYLMQGCFQTQIFHRERRSFRDRQGR